MSIQPTHQERIAARTEFPVEAARIAQYSAAIGDAEPARLAGQAAHPSFAVVPIIPPVVAARHTISSLPGLHAYHHLTVHAPILAGMTVATDTQISSIRASAAGLVIGVATRSSAGGTLLNEQEFGVLIPADRRSLSRGTPIEMRKVEPATRAMKPDVELSHSFGRDLGLAYAQASGDLSPYTFDDAAARERGLPGAIVGGICTMSFAIRAMVEGLCDGDAGRLVNLTLRFSGLLRLIDEQLVTWKFWKIPSTAGAWQFEGHDRAGATIVTHGRLEVRS